MPAELCGWCGEELARGARARAQAGEQVSHGICPTCETRMLEELEQMPERNDHLGAGLAPDGATDVQLGEVLAVAYVHSANGLPYWHAFDPGVMAWLISDGSVSLEGPDGIELWRAFPD